MTSCLLLPSLLQVLVQKQGSDAGLPLLSGHQLSLLPEIDQAGASCRHLSPQGPWPSAVPVNQSSVHQSSVHLFGPGLGPLPNVAVSSSLEVLSRPLSMPLVGMCTARCLASAWTSHAVWLSHC